MTSPMIGPMTTRRAFFLTAGAGFVAACGGGPPGPATVNVAVAGQPGMNPGPDGSDRPVTVSILRLRDVGAFNAADFFALQEDPAAVLGADLVGLDQIAISPGGSATKAISFEPEAGYVGVVAALREPGGRVWRAAAPVTPGSTVEANIALGPGGLGLQLS